MEYRNAMEKVIRTIPLFLLLLLGLEFRCELFHATLRDVPASVYPTIESDITETGFSDYLRNLDQSSAMTGEGYFFADYTDKTVLMHSFDVYVSSEKVKDQLAKSIGIINGEYNSLINGSVKIHIHPISEFRYDKLKRCTGVLICGDMKEASLFYDNLDQQFDVKQPDILQADENDMIILVWSMVSAFMVLLAIGYVLHNKKEVLIREINGEDVTQIVITSVFSDVIIYEVAYIMATWIMSRFISGDYKPHLAFIIYETGVIISALMNLIYLKSDVRSVFANVTAGKGTMVFLYMLKTLVFAIAVVSIAGNLDSLKKARMSVNADGVPEVFRESVFLSLKGNSDTDRNWKEIYTYHSDDLRPVIDLNITGGKNPIVIVNQYALQLMPEKIQQTVRVRNHITVFAPKNYDTLKEDVEGVAEMYMLHGIREYDTRLYSHQNIPVIKATGMDMAIDPVIIYCPEDIRLKSSAVSNDKNIIYHVSVKRMKELLNDYGIAKNDAVISSAYEVMQYNMNFMVRLVRFLSSFCILIIIMDTVTTITMTDMQYRAHGMEFAIRKILGESLIEKNKCLFTELNVADAAIIFVAMIIGQMTGWWGILPAVITGVIIMMIENTIIVGRSTMLEKISVKKILKGGCL